MEKELLTAADQPIQTSAIFGSQAMSIVPELRLIFGVVWGQLSGGENGDSVPGVPFGLAPGLVFVFLLVCRDL